MTSSEFETEATRPVAAHCDSAFLYVTLADGRQVRATVEQQGNIELEFCGVWWPDLDEGVSVKGLLLGWKAPHAKPPSIAAE